MVPVLGYQSHLTTATKTNIFQLYLDTRAI